jgi:fructose-bisphosphate aldolase class I
MDMAALSATARAIVAPGKGILAADESGGTIKKRFDSIGVESTEATRRAYRQMLFTTAGVAQYVSGVILYDETIRQSTEDGRPFPELLAGQGVVPGIKVDTGAKPLAGAPGCANAWPSTTGSEPGSRNGERRTRSPTRCRRPPAWR